MRNNSWVEWVARVAGPGFTLFVAQPRKPHSLRRVAWQQWALARTVPDGTGTCGGISSDSCLSVSSGAEDQVGRPGHLSGTLRLATPSACHKRRTCGLWSLTPAALLMDTLRPQGKVIAIDWHLSIPGSLSSPYDNCSLIS